MTVTQTDKPANVDADAVPRAARRTRRGRLLRIVGSIGRVLVASGVVVLLFVAYQLWGTGLREAASQQSLRAEFDQMATAAPTPQEVDDSQISADEPEPAPSDAAAPTMAPAPAAGDPVAVLRSPRLDSTRSSSRARTSRLFGRARAANPGPHCWVSPAMP